MKDERTLADRAVKHAGPGYAESMIGPNTKAWFAQMVEDHKAMAQALRSQPSVEEVAGVIAMTIDVEDGVVTGFNEAARQITALYKGEGDDRP